VTLTVGSETRVLGLNITDHQISFVDGELVVAGVSANNESKIVYTEWTDYVKVNATATGAGNGSS
jgi:hypothetical protein